MKTFFMVGFFVLLVLLGLAARVFVRSNPMMNQGAPGWTDMYSSAPAETIGFLDRTLGIKVAKVTKTNDGSDYHSIKAAGQFWPFAGIMQVPLLPNGQKTGPHTVVYLTVKDYDAVHQKMLENAAVPVLVNEIVRMKEGDMKFGIYVVPGGVTIGIAQYGNIKE